MPLAHAVSCQEFAILLTWALLGVYSPLDSLMRSVWQVYDGGGAMGGSLLHPSWFIILAGSKSPRRHSPAKATRPAGSQHYGDGA